MDQPGTTLIRGDGAGTGGGMCRLHPAQTFLASNNSMKVLPALQMAQMFSSQSHWMG